MEQALVIGFILTSFIVGLLLGSILAGGGGNRDEN